MLVAVGGLSGTGKSVLARMLAPLLAPLPGAVVLRSDALRKQLFGVEETDRLPAAAYQPEINGRVYQCWSNAPVNSRRRAIPSWSTRCLPARTSGLRPRPWPGN